MNLKRHAVNWVFSYIKSLIFQMECPWNDLKKISENIFSLYKLFFKHVHVHSLSLLLLARRQISPELTLRSHGTLSVSIVRLVIRALKCRIQWRLLLGSLGHGMRLITRRTWWLNQRHWHMTVVVVAGWNVRILTRQSITAWDIRTFSYGCCRCTYQWHDESFAVRWRDMRAEVVMHWVAVARWDGIKIGAVPKRGIRILATNTLVLPSSRLVRVVRVLLAVDGSQSLCFHDERLLFFVA